MKVYYLKMVIILLLILLIIPNICTSEFIDIEDINKSMALFEKAFQENNKDNLHSLSDRTFLKSSTFKKIVSYVLNNSVNLGYTKEKCIKEFLVEKGKLKNYKLLVVFEKKKEKYDGHWFVMDAYLEKKESNNKKIVFRDQQEGFRPLAIEYNFSDFILFLNKYKKNENKLRKFIPFGVPLSFFKNNKLKKSENSTLFITNIIIYTNLKIEDLIYIKLKYHNDVKNNKRGWLINESDSMINYYQKYEEKDSDLVLFANSMSKKIWIENINRRNYNLSKKSNYFYSITSLKKVRGTGNFFYIRDIIVSPKENFNRIKISLLLQNDLDISNIKLQSSKINNRITLRFNEFVHISNQFNHNYLNLHSSESNSVIISVKKNPPPFYLNSYSIDRTYIDGNRITIEIIKK